MTHSLMTEPDSSHILQFLALYANYAYVIIAVLGYLLFSYQRSSDIRLQTDHYILLLLLSLCVPVISSLVNRTLFHDSGLLLLAAPLFVCIVSVQVLEYRDIAICRKLITIYGLVNAFLCLLWLIPPLMAGELSPIPVLFSDRNGFVRYMAIVNVGLLSDLFIRKRNSGRYSRVHIAMITMVFLTVLVQMSRSGYLVYLSSMSIVLFVLGGKRSRLFYLVALAVACVPMILLLKYRFASDRIEILNVSDLQRIALLKAGIAMIKASPVFGIGYHMSIYRFTEFADKHFFGIGHITSIHNWFVNVWAEQGIIGLTVFLVLTLSLAFRHFRIAFRNEDDQKRGVSIFCASSLYILLFDGLFLPNYDYESIFWVIVTVSRVALIKSDHFTAAVREQETPEIADQGPLEKEQNGQQYA